MLRYLIQIVAMLVDLIVLFIISLCVYFSSQYNGLMSLGWLIMSIAMLSVFMKDGGLNAWKPKKVRKFLDNAKKMGL